MTYVAVSAATNGRQLIVRGEAPENHDCASMGCTGVEHIIVRVQLTRSQSEALECYTVGGANAS